MRIEVHVDRLVLDGVTLVPTEQVQVRAAIRRGLERILASKPIPASLMRAGAAPAVNAPPAAPSRSDTPESIGARIALAVHSALELTR